MLTLSEIRSRVRTRFEASSSTRWSDVDVNAAINEGLAELSEATRYYERSASLLLKEKRTYYDLRGLTPEIPLSVTAIWHEPGVRWLTPIHLCDIGYEEWEETRGSPISWFIRGQFWLGLWPSPSADLDENIRVYYTGVAPALEEDGEEPAQLPDEFVPAIEEYALYELHQREGETEKALFWWGKYSEREKALEQHMAHRVTTARTGSIGRV
jgi:hypothetical protein